MTKLYLRRKGLAITPRREGRFQIPKGRARLSTRTFEIHNVCIFECSTEGPPPRSDRDAVDIISEAVAHGARFLLLHADWLGDEFFRLKTRIAGAIIQKFVTYGFRAVIVGDISRHLAESSALRDFVYECNHGNHCWFLSNLQELEDRLEREFNR